MCSTAATAPAFSEPPSMIMASSWTWPSQFKCEPKPASKVGSSSRITMAEVTASIAAPPEERIFHPASSARCMPARQSPTDPSGMFQAPPWMIREGFKGPRKCSQTIITHGDGQARRKARRVCGCVNSGKAEEGGRKQDISRWQAACSTYEARKTMAGAREKCARLTRTANSVAVPRLVRDGFFCAQAGVGADLQLGEFVFAGGIAFR